MDLRVVETSGYSDLLETHQVISAFAFACRGSDVAW